MTHCSLDIKKCPQPQKASIVNIKLLQVNCSTISFGYVSLIFVQLLKHWSCTFIVFISAVRSIEIPYHKEDIRDKDHALFHKQRTL